MPSDWFHKSIAEANCIIIHVPFLGDRMGHLDLLFSNTVECNTILETCKKSITNFFFYNVAPCICFFLRNARNASAKRTAPMLIPSA